MSIVGLLASILMVEWIHGYGDIFSLLPVSRFVRNNDKSCFETSFEVRAHVPEPPLRHNTLRIVTAVIGRS